MRASNFRSAIGERYGLLTVTAEGFGKCRRVTVRCDCGTVKDVLLSTIRSRSVVSCGCHRKANRRTHGCSKMPERVAWADMIRRCHNPMNKKYADYGGRGIKVCDHWRTSFAAFFADMGKRPEGHELDRIDNDGDYEPSNCRWATRTQQLRNQRRTRLCTMDGQTKSLSEWAEIYNMPSAHVSGRVRYGWDLKRALTTPIRKRTAV